MKRAWLLQFRNQGLGFIREPAAFVFNLLVPLFIVLVEAFAFGGSEATGSSLPGLRVVDTLPGLAGVMFVMIIGLFGASVGLASMIEARTLAGASLRPGGVAAMVTAYMAVLVALTAAGLVIAIATLMLGWNVDGAAKPMSVLGLLVLASVSFLALGTVIAGLVGTPRSAQGICSAVFFPMLFLSGAVFPLSSFPGPLRLAGELLPGYHVAELLYATWLPAQPFPWWSLVYLAVFAGAGLLAAKVVFGRREGL